MQYVTQDYTPLLSSKQCTTIQNMTGSVLYYSREVDPTVLIPLDDIATEQTTATEKTQTATSQLLDYLATHPDATISFYASDMILHIHSDASYFSVSKARSRLGVLFYLGYNSTNQDKIKNVVASAAESEDGVCFQNSQTAAPLRITLMELGHIQ
jgi:hypothetical protein